MRVFAGALMYNYLRVCVCKTKTATLLPFWNNASIRLPGVLHTNVGHSTFGYRMF